MSVTVAISTWEGYRDRLAKAVSSCKGADEILVIDNGWTCRRLAMELGVGYIGRDPNDTVCTSRNLAIDAATSDYLIHLDGDDWLACVPKPEGDWYYGDLFVCDDEGRIVARWDYSQFPRTKDAARAFAAEHQSLPTPMKAAFRVAWLREHDLYWHDWPNVIYAEDCRTCLEYHEANPEIVYGSPFYVYRWAAGREERYASRKEIFQRDLLDYIQGKR